MTYGVKKTGLLSNALELTERELLQFGKTLIVAPHADDESLACGGTAARLRTLGLDVHILVVTDGSQSHPGSVKYSAEDRAALRRNEIIAAAEILGIRSERVTFTGLLDGDVPSEYEEGFDAVVKMMSRLLLQIQPDTVFIPYRLDPHRDHIATSQIMRRAFSVFKTSPRIIEYPVWLWELGVHDAYPDASQMKTWKVEMGSQLATKRRAIAEHQSQLGNVIHDDPSGFVLTPDLLAHFELPFEIFFESY
jgi:LmbE family N-acetylglucosaminyl deacetylase